MELPTKELGDVVKAVGICSGDGGCVRCPYYQSNGRHLCLSNEGNHMLKDAHYYLTKYYKNWLGLNVGKECKSS
jgi:hypothetical protein